MKIKRKRLKELVVEELAAYRQRKQKEVLEEAERGLDYASYGSSEAIQRIYTLYEMLEDELGQDKLLDELVQSVGHKAFMRALEEIAELNDIGLAGETDELMEQVNEELQVVSEKCSGKKEE